MVDRVFGLMLVLVFLLVSVGVVISLVHLNETSMHILHSLAIDEESSK